MHTTLIQQGLTLLFLIGWLLMTTGIGRLALSLTAIRFSSTGETFFTSAGLGVMISGYALFLLGVTTALSPLGIILMLVSLTLLSIPGWLCVFQIAPTVPQARSTWDLWAAPFLAILLLASLLLVLTPENGKDALIYHLALPKRYLLNHGFYFMPGNAFAGYPMLAEMHYHLALFLRNDILAKEMNYAILCVTLLGMGLFTRYHFKNHAFPALSMLIFLSIPSVFMISHVAYNDLFVTFFTVAAIYAFFRWTEGGPVAWLILGGLFSGSAAACKYTALLLLPLGCFGILWSASLRKLGVRGVLKVLALFITASFMAGSPFYLKNWFMFGNPFFPFLYKLFGGRGWDSDQARLYDLFVQGLGMGRGFLDYLLLPWNLSLRAKLDSPQFDGILGPIFLLTLPFLAGLRRWETAVRILLVYVLLSFLFWASSAQQIRYLIPLLAPLALVAGAILSRYRMRKPIFLLLVGLVTASLVFNGYHIAHHFMKISPLQAAVGIESRDSFLSRTLPTYPMYRFVNQDLPADARILLIYMKNYTFLCDRDCYSDAMFEAHTLQKILQGAAAPDMVRDRLRTMGFTHILYNDSFLLGELSPLSPDQQRLFLDFQNSHLQAIRFEGPYRLYRLSRS